MRLNYKQWPCIEYVYPDLFFFLKSTNRNFEQSPEEYNMLFFPSVTVPFYSDKIIQILFPKTFR